MIYINRLNVKLGFGPNFRNRSDLTILNLGIDPKFKLISIVLKSTQFDSTRFSISILEIESNC